MSPHATQGELTEPRPDRAVPAAIAAAVRRGLRTDARERWPSMQALLDALQPIAPPPRRWPWIAVGGVALAAIAAIAVARLASEDPPDVGALQRSAPTFAGNPVPMLVHESGTTVSTTINAVRLRTSSSRSRVARSTSRS